MWRKREQDSDQLEAVTSRLREERPTVDPLRLDAIKTTAMARAGSQRRAGSLGRRLTAGALTVGLMAGGTGGVLAEGGASAPAGTAAQAQYGKTCTTGSTLNSSGVCVPGSGTGANNNHKAAKKTKKKAKKKVKAKHVQKGIAPKFTG